MSKRDLPIHVDDRGDGPSAVVFVHSLGGRGAQFEAQLQHLAPRHRAVAFDLRGHGARAMSPGARFGIEDFAADLAAVMDELELLRAVLLGHSLGALVALHYAHQNPERVAGLLLLDPSSDGRLVPREAAEGMLAGLDADYAGTIEPYWQSMIVPSSAAVRDRVMEDLRASSASAVRGALRAVLEFDPVTPLRDLHVPCRVLISELNETPSALHALVPSLPAERVPGVGHWIQLDAPNRVNEALDAFLASVSLSPRDRKIDYVELRVRDLSRARSFYGGIFGWRFTEYGPSYLAFSDGRLEGGFTTADGPPTPGGPLLIFYAERLEDMLGRVLAAGGELTRPIFAFPGGRRFQFRDPDGYELAVWSESGSDAGPASS